MVRHQPSLITIVLIGGILNLALAEPVHAGEKREARKHFKAGLTLLKAEDYAGAAAEFSTSVELYPTKNALFNLANCYKALHEYAKALEAMDRLVALFDKKLNRQWRQEIEGFTQELESITAKLTISVNLDGATLRLNGKELGQSPLPDSLILGPGEHTIEVIKPGYKPVRMAVNLLSSTQKHEHFDLEEIEIEPPAPPVEPVVEPDLTEADGDRSNWRFTTLFWIGAGGTVATGAGAAVLLGMAESKAKKYNEDKLGNAGLKEDAERFGKIGLGLGIGAGVFAIGTTIIFILDNKTETADELISGFVLPGSVGVRF